eukprot:3073251-Pyramimonas_sp.AAC.6
MGGETHRAPARSGQVTDCMLIARAIQNYVSPNVLHPLRWRRKHWFFKRFREDLKADRILRFLGGVGKGGIGGRVENRPVSQRALKPRNRFSLELAPSTSNQGWFDEILTFRLTRGTIPEAMNDGVTARPAQRGTYRLHQNPEA